VKALLAVTLILALALAVQSVRVANMEADLSAQGRELDSAHTQITLLEEDKRGQARATAGLQAQVEACQRANARDAETARSRAAIARNAKPVQARPGQVVDDATNRAAAAHLNRAGR